MHLIQFLVCVSKLLVVQIRDVQQLCLTIICVLLRSVIRRGTPAHSISARIFPSEIIQKSPTIQYIDGEAYYNCEKSALETGQGLIESDWSRATTYLVLGSFILKK